MFPPPLLRRISSHRGIDDDEQACFRPDAPPRIQNDDDHAPAWDDDEISSLQATSTVDDRSTSSNSAKEEGEGGSQRWPQQYVGHESDSGVSRDSPVPSEGSFHQTSMCMSGDSDSKHNISLSDTSISTPKMKNRRVVARPGILPELMLPSSIFDPFSNPTSDMQNDSTPDSFEDRISNSTSDFQVAREIEWGTAMLDGLDSRLLDEPREEASDVRASNDSQTANDSSGVIEESVYAENLKFEVPTTAPLELEKRDHNLTKTTGQEDLSFARKYWWAFVVFSILTVGLCTLVTLILCTAGRGHNNPPKRALPTPAPTVSPTGTSL